MAIEIERKFLVKGDFSKQVSKSERIMQGYICSQPGRTVRIRIRGEEGFLTIKGASDENGLSRYEFEQKIPPADAEELFAEIPFYQKFPFNFNRHDHLIVTIVAPKPYSRKEASW